jgi:hypothetical protein
MVWQRAVALLFGRPQKVTNNIKDIWVTEVSL